MTARTHSDWFAALDGIREALEQQPDGKRSFYPIRHGTMRVGLYAPRGSDPQQPHDQDEIYIIHAGSGSFRKAGEVQPFKPGDVIFVEAGVEHRFEDFTEDFETWVVFWGAEGGES